ncbi:HemK2/MTQ2 family protein methyltransferase [Amycolatopsis anabasis]|uniref:HemK2/MTQ2 family protein methyltransferase n=1 Tax=Amycolatopsis anabasis TaxID=1840409 RepID=UPI003CCE2786
MRMPGVYRPQADTWLLTRAMREAGMPAGARVLDLGTGSGALAVAAAAQGAREVVAVDRSRRAVLCANLNARVRRLPVRAKRADLLDFRRARGRFDVVLANPPYVPCRPGGATARTPDRAWDAGPDGRAHLDPLCANAPSLLTARGMLLLVHSDLCGAEHSLARLRRSGLKASVVARATVPFGPVLRGRTGYLLESGLIEPGQDHEELVVIRADRTERPR